MKYHFRRSGFYDKIICDPYSYPFLPKKGLLHQKLALQKLVGKNPLLYEVNQISDMQVAVYTIYIEMKISFFQLSNGVHTFFLPLKS